MTDSDSGSAPRVADAIPLHIISCITQGLEDIYGRFSPYAERNRHVDCLRAMEVFRRDVLDHMEFIHSQLRRRLSAAARVNQLPADVLIHIFASMGFADIVTATHVCHQWRKLALETPGLWADLTLDGPVLKDAHVLLERAKAAPVNLELSPAFSTFVSSDTTISTLKTYMNGLRHLSIRPIGPRPATHGWGESRYIPLPLPPALQLQSLSIDWDSNESWIKLLPPRDTTVADTGLEVTMHGSSAGGSTLACADFSSLREVTLLGGVDGVEFLRQCTQIRLLVLFVPAALRGADMVRIIAANPQLERLVLRFCKRPLESQPTYPPRESHRLVPTSLRSIELGEHDSFDRPDDSRWTWHPMHGVDLAAGVAVSSFLFSRIDCSDIAEITIDFSPAAIGTLYENVLEQLQGIVELDTIDGQVLLCDARGYKRHFTHRQSHAAFAQHVPLQGMGTHLRALRLSMEIWNGLNHGDGAPCPIFPSLEELWLWGYNMEPAPPRPLVQCPRLQYLTLHVFPKLRRANSWEEWQAWGMGNTVVVSDYMPNDDTRLALGVAAAMRLICSDPVPRLHRLTLISRFRHCHGRTWTCASPLPAVITCRADSDSDSDYSEDTLAWPEFPATSVIPHSTN